MFSAEVKAGLLEHLPGAMIIDIIAASEGTMGMSIATADAPAVTGRFQPSPGVIVITEDGRQIEPGSDEAGLVALPGGAEGYYKDDSQDRRHLPAHRREALHDPRRLRHRRRRRQPHASRPGLVLHQHRRGEGLPGGGRRGPQGPARASRTCSCSESTTSGSARRSPPSSPSRATRSMSDDLLAQARQKLAAYKIPRAVVVVDEVPRTQVGKADYPTARMLFADGSS